ncbi:protocadherin alpha-3-like [Brienomyrus brachyistius]|uniref:protocadherin alpha-3-like n=1 Tax=Brienomyrus brachyistius TaxID=42636 RepID=UPI0020B42C82|nr:protocadherin alpha-3-like [Brienomyrus brachyistius]
MRRNRRGTRAICVLLYTLLSSLAATHGQIIYSVAEETTPGATVGNLAKDLNVNLEDLEMRKLRIAGPSNKYFGINVKTSVLFVKDRIDRELLCSQSAVCFLDLEAIVEDPFNIYRIRINVTDVNDQSPLFPLETLYINVSESTLPGARFVLLNAEDEDVGANTIKTYRMSSNEHFFLDVQSAGEQSVSAELVLQKALDREKEPVIHLILTAVDGGKPARTGNLKIIVNVLDINDNSPIFSKPLYKVTVVENVPPGTEIIKVNATDTDEGINSEIIYSFSNHKLKDVIDVFNIDATSGVISVKGEIDYEEKKVYEIRVQAQDRGHSPMVSHCKVLVEVTDVNDNIPTITITPISNSVREDARIGTVVALVAVSDSDEGANGNVNCVISHNVPFRLQRNYKNYYSFEVSEPLDREKTSLYNVTITATDEGSPPLSKTKVIHVLVSDVNDNAPRFFESELNFYLKENNPLGALIQTVTAFDADANENAHVTYSLMNSNSKGAPVSTMVNINSITGELYSMQAFDYEETKTFQFRVLATDSGVPPLSSNVTVNVFILDVNDNSPQILPPYSDQGSVNTESIPYSAEAGYFVAKIRAVDADSGYNALLSYHISEPKGSTLFRIGTNTGEIRTKRRMSDNDLRTHPLVILVSDSGDVSLSATVSMDVAVVENNAEIQTHQLRLRPRKEESFTSLNLYLLIAVVSVSIIFLLSIVTLIAAKFQRTYGTFDSCSAPAITTHPDGSWSYSKSAQQYDVCFSSDTLKSEITAFPTPLPPIDVDVFSINGGDSSMRNQTLPKSEKVRRRIKSLYVFFCYHP